jgi:hypothetical protein
MTYTYTFDSTTLQNVAPLNPIVIGSGTSFEITVQCATEDYADITAIQGKAGVANKNVLVGGKTHIQTTGTKGTLVLGPLTVTNCVIMDGVKVEEIPGNGGLWWKYSMTFAQDTS